jgi:hypothetical protein
MPPDWNDIKTILFFNKRARDRLLTASITTVDQLVKLSREDLLGIVRRRGVIDEICWVLRVTGRNPPSLWGGDPNFGKSERPDQRSDR